MKTEKEKVLDALENPNYTWRTIRGISKETRLDSSIVRKIISLNGDSIVQSSIDNERGEELFASRKKHRESGSLFKRLSSALQNRGA